MWANASEECVSSERMMRIGKNKIWPTTYLFCSATRDCSSRNSWLCRSYSI